MSCLNSHLNELQVVEYPGKVENVNKMLDTLGGIKKISQAFGGEQKKLELHYHPKNPYNKGITSEKFVKYGLLLAIKVRRYNKKKHSSEHSVRVLGHSSQIFIFSNLCDFQYLPLCKEPSSQKLFCAMNILKPGSVSDAKYFLQTEAQVLCLPTVFARSSSVTTPVSGIFRYDSNDNGQQSVLETLPKYVSDSLDYVTFSMLDTIPMGPDSNVINRTKAKFITDEQFQRIKKLFEECPIWTRVALLYESQISNDKLKKIVPALAFFYSTGPWRSLYVRYGFDPRKNFESRRYQTFNFRIRFRTGVAEFVSVRSEKLRKQQSNSDELKGDSWSQDINYPYFSEHKLPRARQCIMRYCDLHVPKIKEMLDKIPSPLAGAVCNEKTGWLPAGFDAQVRLIICNSVKELLRLHSQKEIDSKVPQADEEDCSEDLQTDEENLDDSVEPMEIE